MPAPTPGLPTAGPAADYGGRDRAAWDAIRDSDRATDFAAFLGRFPDSALAFLAQSRLDELRRTTTAALPPPRAAQPAPAPLASLPSPPATAEGALGLKREDWQRLQEALTALGFDTRGKNGRPGPGTRKAVAAWQRSKRQEATGYLTSLERDLILSEAQTKLAEVDRSAQARIEELNKKQEPILPFINHQVSDSVPVRKITLKGTSMLKLFAAPNMQSTSLGFIGGEITISGPAFNGFVPVKFGKEDGYVLLNELNERLETK